MTRSAYSALPPARKRSIHVVAFAALLTGIAWAALHFAAPGWIDEEISRRTQVVLLKIHGGAAMLALIALGVLLATHILPALKNPENRKAGITLLAGTATLALTGWGLYYLGDESLRVWTSNIHIAVGMAAAAAFIWHIRYRKRGANAG